MAETKLKKQAMDSEVLTKSASFVLFKTNEAVVVGDGLAGLTVPLELNGWNITDAVAAVYDKGVTGSTDVQIRRRRGGANVDVLSTKITVGDEWFARDGVINTSNDDLATGDQLFIDVDAIHSGTAPNGLSVTLTFSL